MALAENGVALNVDLSNVGNATAPFSRKAVLSHVKFYNNQQAIQMSALTPGQSIIAVANNVTMAGNTANANLDLANKVELTLAVAGTFRCVGLSLK